MRKRLLVLPLAVAAAAGASVLPAGAASTVRLKDNLFAPKSTSVSKGTTVTFRWAGKAPHNVTVAKGPVKFHSKTQVKGTYSHRFSKAGTYRIVCTIHPGMNLTVRVK
jgi:plastocyanin